MFEEIKCKLSKKELEFLYYDKRLTQKQLAPILGVKSDTTVRRMLHEYGIDTNKNKMRSNITKRGMSDSEFKNYLKDLYLNKKYSINKISDILGITSVATRRYLKNYNIPLYTQKESAKLFCSGINNPRWNGGVHKKNNGYIEIYCPSHPYADKRGYVYEHRLVMEKHIGRYLLPEEIIHHKDLNKTNNNISNLQIVSASEHTLIHAKLMGGGLHGKRRNIN